MITLESLAVSQNSRVYDGDLSYDQADLKKLEELLNHLKSIDNIEQKLEVIYSLEEYHDPKVVLALFAALKSEPVSIIREALYQVIEKIRHN